MLFYVPPLEMFSEPVFNTHTDAYTHTYMHTNQKSKIICHFLRNSPSRIVFFLSENSTIRVDRWWFCSSGEFNSRFCGPAGLGSQSSIDQSLCPCVKALLFWKPGSDLKKWFVPLFVYKEEGMRLLRRPPWKEVSYLVNTDKEPTVRPGVPTGVSQSYFL